MNKHIRVEWIEHKYVNLPAEYTSSLTKEDYDSYMKALKESEIKHQGEIINFVNSFFGGTKAIIEGIDKKLYKVNIDDLKIIENYD